MCSFFSMSAAFAIALALASAPMETQARQGGDLGVGFIAGNPSGISGKYWLGETNAVDFIAGFSFYDEWFQVDVDYVWHEFGLIPIASGQLPLYYGMGAWSYLQNDVVIGIRGVVGLEYLFPSAPLDVFLEIAPGASILPETEFTMMAGIGMRYFF